MNYNVQVMFQNVSCKTNVLSNLHFLLNNKRESYVYIIFFTDQLSDNSFPKMIYTLSFVTNLIFFPRIPEIKSLNTNLYL
jgi:hypothetical protein